ncbi:hypothetical protein GQ42DRAFT_80238 [Ramicandelaber brevisporus]|nr:hypothetical protein GQ42DRAFT_80238 [Ramicandelaber brevisporus]
MDNNSNNKANRRATVASSANSGADDHQQQQQQQHRGMSAESNVPSRSFRRMTTTDIPHNRGSYAPSAATRASSSASGGLSNSQQTQTKPLKSALKKSRPSLPAIDEMNSSFTGEIIDQNFEFNSGSNNIILITGSPIVPLDGRRKSAGRRVSFAPKTIVKEFAKSESDWGRINEANNIISMNNSNIPHSVSNSSSRGVGFAGAFDDDDDDNDDNDDDDDNDDEDGDNGDDNGMGDINMNNTEISFGNNSNNTNINNSSRRRSSSSRGSILEGDNLFEIPNLSTVGNGGYVEDESTLNLSFGRRLVASINPNSLNSISNPNNVNTNSGSGSGGFDQLDDTRDITGISMMSSFGQSFEASLAGSFDESSHNMHYGSNGSGCTSTNDSKRSSIKSIASNREMSMSIDQLMFNNMPQNNLHQQQQQPEQEQEQEQQFDDLTDDLLLNSPQVEKLTMNQESHRTLPSSSSSSATSTVHFNMSNSDTESDDSDDNMDNVDDVDDANDVDGHVDDAANVDEVDNIATLDDIRNEQPSFGESDIMDITAPVAPLQSSHVKSDQQQNQPQLQYQHSESEFEFESEPIESSFTGMIDTGSETDMAMDITGCVGGIATVRDVHSSQQSLRHPLPPLLQQRQPQQQQQQQQPAQLEDADMDMDMDMDNNNNNDNEHLAINEDGRINGVVDDDEDDEDDEDGDAMDVDSATMNVTRCFGAGLSANEISTVDQHPSYTPSASSTDNVQPVQAAEELPSEDAVYEPEEEASWLDGGDDTPQLPPGPITFNEFLQMVSIEFRDIQSITTSRDHIKKARLSTNKPHSSRRRSVGTPAAEASGQAAFTQVTSSEAMLLCDLSTLASKTINECMESISAMEEQFAVDVPYSVLSWQYEPTGPRGNRDEYVAMFKFLSYKCRIESDLEWLTWQNSKLSEVSANYDQSIQKLHSDQDALEQQLRGNSNSNNSNSNNSNSNNNNNNTDGLIPSISQMTSHRQHLMNEIESKRARLVEMRQRDHEHVEELQSELADVNTVISGYKQQIAEHSGRQSLITARLNDLNGQVNSLKTSINEAEHAIEDTHITTTAEVNDLDTRQLLFSSLSGTSLSLSDNSAIDSLTFGSMCKVQAHFNSDSSVAQLTLDKSLLHEFPQQAQDDIQLVFDGIHPLLTNLLQSSTVQALTLWRSAEALVRDVMRARELCQFVISSAHSPASFHMSAHVYLPVSARCAKLTASFTVNIADGNYSSLTVSDLVQQLQLECDNPSQFSSKQVKQLIQSVQQHAARDAKNLGDNRAGMNRSRGVLSRTVSQLTKAVAQTVS